MKTTKIQHLILSLIIFSFIGCVSSTGNKYELRPYKEVKLQNGLQVLLVKDNSLPYFSLQMLVKSGSVEDPISKSGLAHLVASLLNKSTHKHDALEIADIIGQMGAEFGVSVDDDFTMLSASSLSDQKLNLISIFSEMVTSPTFPEEEISRAQKQTISSIQRVADNPPGFADIAYSTFIYGAHPYGRSVSGTIRDVKSIKKKDIQNYYQENYSPNNSILAVTGDFNEEDIQALSKAFSSWKPHKVAENTYPVFPSISGINIKLVDKADLAQTQIRIGHKAIKRTNPDYLKLRLASIVLGGGFASRLMVRIRRERGLTYSIRSYFGAQKDFGAFTVSTFTRNDKVGETLAETLRELKKVQENGINQEELDSAKALAKGTFPRVLETAESFSQNLLYLRFYGISDDYLRDYYKNIDAISLKDVNAAIARYLDPENLKVLVFAPKNKTIDQLRPIGLLEVENYKQFLR